MHKEDLENPLHQARDQRGSAQGLFDRERRAFENGKEKKAEVFWTYGAAQQLAEDCDGGQSSWKTGERMSEKMGRRCEGNAEHINAGGWNLGSRQADCHNSYVRARIGTHTNVMPENES